LARSCCQFLFRGDHFPDDGSEAFGAQIDREAIGANRDPLDQQPSNACLFGREQGFPEVLSKGWLTVEPSASRER